jgi:predicted hydrolase (HD superfamily)
MEKFDRKTALELLEKYNKESFHIQHAKTLEDVMRYFAENYGYEDEKNFWALVGLLHDVDYEKYPEEHTKHTPEILKEIGASEKFIRAVVSHGYGLVSDVKPEHFMEKVLFAVDELTGLIWAVAIMRPSKSVSDLEVPSVMKKFKNLKFAAGCSRDVIEKGAEMLNMPLEELVEKTIMAMRTI